MLLGEQCCLTVGLCKAVRTERDGFHGINIVSLDQKKILIKKKIVFLDNRIRIKF